MKIRVVTEDITWSKVPVRYDANVEVIGTIRSGANLEIEGDLEVFGSVEDATIGVGGSVFIEGGFLGTGTGRIRCGGDFQARFIQNQQVTSNGSIRILRSLVSSRVLSSGDIVVGNRAEGGIIGGQVNAYGEVKAAVIGSPRPVMTRIEVGFDPVVLEEIAELESEAMDLTRKRIGFTKDLRTVLEGDAAGASSETIVDLKAAADAIQADLTLVGMKILDLRKGATANSDGTVTVWQRSYPPVEVAICSSKILNDRETGPVVFRLFEDRVIHDTWSIGYGGTT